MLRSELPLILRASQPAELVLRATNIKISFPFTAFRTAVKWSDKKVQWFKMMTCTNVFLQLKNRKLQKAVKENKIPARPDVAELRS